jgi:hypothetical protein
MSDEKKQLTPEQGEQCLLDGNSIHTFRNGGWFIIGCDIDRKSIMEKMKKFPPTNWWQYMQGNGAWSCFGR